MSEKRRGLGRGLGALIPSSAGANGAGNGTAVARPVDLFFPEGRRKADPSEAVVDATVADESAAGSTVDSSSAGSTDAASKESSSRSSSNGSRKPAAAKSATAKAAPEPAASSNGASTKSSARATDGGKVKATAQKASEAAKARSAGPVAVPDGGPVVFVDAGEPDNGVDLVEVPGVRFAEIRVTDIHPNRKQPRSVFDEDDMAELVHSVREIGVLQPIVVRNSTEPGGEPYELVMGERRWRAVQAAGLETIPAIVRDTTDDDLLRDALLENLHRSQLNPLEEAAAYQQLLEDFGTTHEQLADRIGRSRPQVSNTLRLLKLPPLVQRRVAASVLSAGHARALLALPDAAAMERLAQRIVAEGMSVRATEEAVTLYQDPAKPAKNNIPRPGARHERLDYLASSLSDRLDTNVKISLGVRKGRVSIEFASVEDLNRIMDVLAPGSDN
ncbi:Chromosome (plasmid) partitioning protein ParB / Stage 0 sporulation protein J [Arthrobacter sp. 9AX]|uniref:ParB/RepB/Spo0J family partition protein n=1 Tax=Arthrobacter sp. 9AX TaxID=2653131 RepID=UPI0012F37626|nr:ParB/RepB/Spo0J family partition protein [Arthrobacter sp. 9AX]VXB01493.1 Chromosome (plasmid) partitioning protein ParB / Stage 0 sporulation protein J [Arthrobacter sp. 9AX]